MERLPDLNKLSHQEKDVLILALWERNAYLEKLVAAQQETIAHLTARVKELEDRFAKNSKNSSKPPSSDGYKRQTRSLRKKSGRKPGGQEGHPGTTLKMVEKPDKTLKYKVDKCKNCHASLEEVLAIDIEKRQVFDIPPLKIEVEEHQVEVKICPLCNTLNKGEFPPDVSQPVQYGKLIKALGVYLNNYQFIPKARTSEFFEDVFEHSISEATLCGGEKECSDKLEKTVEQIKEGVTKSDVVHVDESGFRVEGKLKWLHVASTEQLTFYDCHEKRGNMATNDIGILPVFQGTTVHDGWGPYQKYTCSHALCNAHHLRELIFLEEEHTQEWAGKMKKLLLEIKGSVETRKADGATSLEPLLLVEFERQYSEILEEGQKAQPPPELSQCPPKKGRKKQSKAKNLLDRLTTLRQQTLEFMYNSRSYNKKFYDKKSFRTTEDIKPLYSRQAILCCGPW